MTLPHYAINFIFDLALTKLYVNCLMSTLNARQKLQTLSHSSTFQQHRNLVLSPTGAAFSGSGSGGKQESFLDTSGPVDTVYEGHNDLEYGIHMTKVVERREDPIPR